MPLIKGAGGGLIKCKNTNLYLPSQYVNIPLSSGRVLMQPKSLKDYWEQKKKDDPDYFKRENIRGIKFVSDEEYAQIMDKMQRTTPVVDLRDERRDDERPPKATISR